MDRQAEEAMTRRIQEAETGIRQAEAFLIGAHAAIGRRLLPSLIREARAELLKAAAVLEVDH